MQAFDLIPPEYRKRTGKKQIEKNEPKNIWPILVFALVALVFVSAILADNFLPPLEGRITAFIFGGHFKSQANSSNNFFSGSAPIIPVATLPPSVKIQKKIEINLREQKMIILEDDKKIAEHIISSGRADKRTKPGNFSILTKYPMAYGSGDGQIWGMPYFMGIYMVGNTENGIHELPFVNGWREGAWDLGHPVSHGCVRLGIGEAEKVYNWAEIGTPVWIHY